MPRLKKKIKLCQRCEKFERTTVIVFNGKRVKICDRCAENLKIEEQKQHEVMRGWDMNI